MVSEFLLKSQIPIKCIDLFNALRDSSIAVSNMTQFWEANAEEDEEGSIIILSGSQLAQKLLTGWFVNYL